MSEEESFGRLVEALSPWHDKLVFVGGWAHRLYREHPSAASQKHAPLVTLDADVAFAARETFDGDIKVRLQDAGFVEHLMGEHRPPVSKYTLGRDGAAGFYAEFLTPLVGRSVSREGKPLVTRAVGGVTAQRLRYLDLLLFDPWRVELPKGWGAAEHSELQIPNPVAFIVQKLLIHDERRRLKRAQDVLSIHDAILLFSGEMAPLNAIWTNSLSPAMHSNHVEDAVRKADQLFGTTNDTLRDAAQMVRDRALDPERMRLTIRAALTEMLA